MSKHIFNDSLSLLVILVARSIDSFQELGQAIVHLLHVVIATTRAHYSPQDLGQQVSHRLQQGSVHELIDQLSEAGTIVQVNHMGEAATLVLTNKGFETVHLLAKVLEPFVDVNGQSTVQHWLAIPVEQTAPLLLPCYRRLALLLQCPTFRL